MYSLSRIGGSCVLLEQWLERSLLYLPCRHHIYEIILRSVFDHKFGSTSGPNVPLFQRFQSAWPKLNLNNFNPGLQDTEVSQHLKNSTVCILKFCITELTKIQCREDRYFSNCYLFEWYSCSWNLFSSSRSNSLCLLDVEDHILFKNIYISSRI